MACKLTRRPFHSWRCPRDRSEPRPRHTHTHRTRFELTVVRCRLQAVWERLQCKLVSGCENTRVTRDQPCHLRGMRRGFVLCCFPRVQTLPPFSSAILHRYYYKTGILERVDRRLVYKFGKNAHGWQEDKL